MIKQGNMFQIKKIQEQQITPPNEMELYSLPEK